jgi:hypothetical protein
MHLYHSKVSAAIFLIVALCLTAPLAQAHSVHATEVEAIVQSIRIEARTLVIISAKTKSPREMVWNKSTSFVEDNHFADATKLRARIHVKLYYHSPFFGKPYLTKVVWTSTARQRQDDLTHD